MAAEAEASAPVGRERPLDWRGWRSVALRVALLAVLVGSVAVLIVGLAPGAGRHLAHARAGWLVVEVILELIACSAYAWLFHAVFSYRPYPSAFSRSAQIAVGELGAFAFVPTGVGGPVLRFWALRRGGMPFREIVVGSVAHSAIFNAPYVLAAVLLGAGVVLGVGPGHAPTAVALAPLALILVVVALGGGATLYVRTRRPETAAGWRATTRDAIRTIPDGLRRVPSRLRVPGSLLGAIAYWACDLGVFVAAFHAAGGSAPIGVIALAYMLGQLGNALPLPGGVGGVEPLMLGVLIASGVDAGLGGAAVVLYRFVYLAIQGTLGAVAVATLVPALRRSS